MMPKYKATFVRVEKYIEQREFDAVDESIAWCHAVNLLNEGLEFGGEVIDADECVSTVEGPQDDRPVD